MKKQLQIKRLRLSGNAVRLAVILAMLSGVNNVSYGWAESWRSIRQTAETVVTISADFQQEKHLPILKKPLISKGRLLYQKPDSLRWEYEHPAPSILISHQGRTTRYLKQGETFVKDAGSSVQAMQIVLDEIVNWLGGRFDQSRHFTATLESDNLVVLSPVNEQMTQFVSRIEIVLSQQPGLIESVSIIESETSFTRLVFINTELNEKHDPSLFQNP